MTMWHLSRRWKNNESSHLSIAEDSKASCSSFYCFQRKKLRKTSQTKYNFSENELFIFQYRKNHFTTLPSHWLKISRRTRSRPITTLGLRSRNWAAKTWSKTRKTPQRRSAREQRQNYLRTPPTNGGADIGILDMLRRYQHRCLCFVRFGFTPLGVLEDLWILDRGTLDTEVPQDLSTLSFNNEGSFGHLFWLVQSLFAVAVVFSTISTAPATGEDTLKTLCLTSIMDNSSFANHRILLNGTCSSIYFVGTNVRATADFLWTERNAGDLDFSRGSDKSSTNLR